MATWQFDIFLVPESEIEGRAEVSREVFESRVWWRHQQPPAGYVGQVERVLRPISAWSPNLRVWGSEDGDRIDITVENGLVTEVFARVDARVQPSPFAVALAELAAAWRCVLVLATSCSVIPPDSASLAASLSSSEATRFIQDPEAFLRQPGG